MGQIENYMLLSLEYDDNARKLFMHFAPFIPSSFVTQAWTKQKHQFIGKFQVHIQTHNMEEEEAYI